jgi:hypothetical protein
LQRAVLIANKGFSGLKQMWLIHIHGASAAKTDGGKPITIQATITMADSFYEFPAGNRLL